MTHYAENRYVPCELAQTMVEASTLVEGMKEWMPAPYHDLVRVRNRHDLRACVLLSFVLLKVVHVRMLPPPQHYTHTPKPTCPLRFLLKVAHVLTRVACQSFGGRAESFAPKQAFLLKVRCPPVLTCG